MIDDKYVIGNGTVVNPGLAARQNLDDGAIAAIVTKHRELQAVINALGEADLTARRAAVIAIERFEYQLQKLWGFDQDAGFHTHWMRMPGCTCNRTLNTAVFGQGVRFVAKDCLVHSGLKAPKGVTLREDRVASAP